jgi:Pilus formation protein N terminal region
MMKHFLAAIALSALIAPAAMADPFKVKVDETVTLKLASPANSIVIGNATVADVAVNDPNTLLITGKAFGTTNLLVLDRAGRTIYSNQLAVGGESDGELTVQRRDGTYTYSCFEKCRATPKVGDAPTHFQDVMTTVTAKAATAKGGN